MTSAQTDQSTELAELCEFVSELSAEDTPRSARDQALTIIADTVAAVVAASEAEELARFRQKTMNGSGSTVLAAGLPETSPETAAFLNGLGATWLELDEAGPWGHAAAHLLPVLLAAAEYDRRPGADLVTAFIAGYEVHARLSSATTMRPTLHQSGTVGVVAATLALAKLRDESASTMLNRAAMAAQLMMASSYAGSVAGATIRSVHPAMAARTAFLIEALEQSGFTGAPATLSEILGETLGIRFDMLSIASNLGGMWAVKDSCCKMHGGCGHLHPVFDALAAAFNAEPSANAYPPIRIAPLQADQIRSVIVDVIPSAAELTDPDPKNELAARFSIPFGVAMFLTRGFADWDAFRTEGVERARIVDVASRVRVRGNPRLAWTSEALPAQVRIDLADGSSVYGNCHSPYGWPTRSASKDDVRAKFVALCEPTLGSEAEALWETCMALDQVQPFRFSTPAGTGAL